jgi:hypothetical protein
VRDLLAVVVRGHIRVRAVVVDQRRSGVETGEAVPSGLSEHGVKVCSMKESGAVHPSPTQDACACVDDVCPSTAPESYDSPTVGTSVDDAPGTVIG